MTGIDDSWQDTGVLDEHPRLAQVDTSWNFETRRARIAPDYEKTEAEHFFAPRTPDYGRSL